MKTIYTNLGDRGGPVFREENTPNVEGSEPLNRREKTRGQNLVGGGGDCISQIWKTEKTRLEMVKIAEKGRARPPRDYPLEEKPGGGRGGASKAIK